MRDRWADSAADAKALLGRDDPPPFVVENPGGSAPVLLIGDHAGREIPRALGDLGLSAEAMERHIAWDIGVAGLGQKLAALLDAPFVRQVYSRLVIDCNRVPGAADRVPGSSDGTDIPGNADLIDADVAARAASIYGPYQDAIAAALDGGRTRLVSLHSFTPVFQGFVRPWRYGVLHRGDSALSATMLDLLRREMGEAAGDNQPYAMDGIDNTVPLHADARGLDYLELEVRQDLIADEAGQAAAAALVARLLTEALAAL